MKTICLLCTLRTPHSYAFCVSSKQIRENKKTNPMCHPKQIIRPVNENFRSDPQMRDSRKALKIGLLAPSHTTRSEQQNTLSLARSLARSLPFPLPLPLVSPKNTPRSQQQNTKIVTECALF
jgi:hypothetical protein